MIELVKMSRFSSSENYFIYRHIFKYLAQSGQKLPDSLDKDILRIAEIDFPSFKNKLVPVLHQNQIQLNIIIKIRSIFNVY